MRIPALILVIISLSLLSACRPDSGGCDPACRTGEVCDAATHLCVFRVEDGPDATGPSPGIDLSPVTVHIDSPIPGAVIGGSSLHVTGTVDDPAARMDRLSLSLADGGLVDASIADGVFFADLPVPPDHDFVAASVTAQVTGPTFEAPELTQVDVRIDTVPPTCTLLYPTAGDAVTANASGKLQVYGTAQDGDPNARTTFRLDASADLVNGEGMDDRRAGELTLPANEAGRDGSVTMRTRDSAGNECKASANVWIDTVAPVLSVNPIAAAPNGFINAANNPFHVTGTVTDMSPGLTVSASVDGYAYAAPVAANGTFDLVLNVNGINDLSTTVDVVAKDGAGNLTVASTPVRIDTVAPGLSVSPASLANAKVNLSQLTNGTLHLTWTAPDASAAAASIQLHREGVARADLVQCSASTSVQGDCLLGTTNQDDPASYALSLKVFDAAGNETSYSASFLVDAVAPSFTITPATGARVTGTAFTVQFSEPVTLANGATYTLSPNAAGASATMNGNRDGYTVTGLQPGTLYTLNATPQGTDDFGNPFTGNQWSWFFTAPAAPANLSTLVPGNFSGFDAAADSDGVVTLGAWTVTPAGTSASLSYSLHRLSPSNAAVTNLSGTRSETIPASSGVSLSVNAWLRRAGSTPEGTRVSSLQRTLDGSSRSALYQSGSGGIVTGSSMFIAAEHAAGEVAPTSGEDVGQFVSGYGYSRPNNALKFADADPDLVAFGTNLRWEYFNFRTNNGTGQLELWSQSFVCPTAASCGFAASKVVAGSSLKQHLAGLNAVHLPGGRRLTVWSDSAVRNEHCEGQRDDVVCTKFCTQPAEYTRLSPNAERLQVASANQDNIAIATRFVNGNVELMERDATACSSSWATIAFIPASGISAAKPVMFGAKKGAVLLTATGLKAWVP